MILLRVLSKARTYSKCIQYRNRHRRHKNDIHFTNFDLVCAHICSMSRPTLPISFLVHFFFACSQCFNLDTFIHTAFFTATSAKPRNNIRINNAGPSSWPPTLGWPSLALEEPGNCFYTDLDKPLRSSRMISWYCSRNTSTHAAWHIVTTTHLRRAPDTSNWSMPSWPAQMRGRCEGQPVVLCIIVVLRLEHIHSHHAVHRDLKSHNTQRNARHG